MFAGDAQLGALSRSAACAALPLSTEHYLDFITEDRTQAQNRYETPVILQCSPPVRVSPQGDERAAATAPDNLGRPFRP